MPQPIVLLSSGGKDSVAALYALQTDPAWEVTRQITTFNEEADRVAMHGTRRALVHAQANALELPLLGVDLPEDCSNEVYEARLADALRPLKDDGLKHVAFGDLFLEDIRAYRIDQMQALDLEAVFPVWGHDTQELTLELIDKGCEITLTCVDTDQLDASFLGRRLDRAFLEDLPQGVDPCGENGEFHTFVSDGPGFAFSIPVTTGERVIRDSRFHFLDLLPEAHEPPH